MARPHDCDLATAGTLPLDGPERPDEQAGAESDASALHRTSERCVRDDSADRRTDDRSARDRREHPHGHGTGAASQIEHAALDPVELRPVPRDRHLQVLHDPIRDLERGQGHLRGIDPRGDELVLPRRLVALDLDVAERLEPVALRADHDARVQHAVVALAEHVPRVVVDLRSEHEWILTALGDRDHLPGRRGLEPEPHRLLRQVAVPGDVDLPLAFEPPVRIPERRLDLLDTDPRAGEVRDLAGRRATEAVGAPVALVGARTDGACLGRAVEARPGARVGPRRVEVGRQHHAGDAEREQVTHGVPPVAFRATVVKSLTVGRRRSRVFVFLW